MTYPATVTVVNVESWRNRPGQFKVDVDIRWTSGFWIWKKRHRRRVTFLSQDGIQFHFAPDQPDRGRAWPGLEEQLYEALADYQKLQSAIGRIKEME